MLASAGLANLPGRQFHEKWTGKTLFLSRCNRLSLDQLGFLTRECHISLRINGK
jgi:hypothetical protein